MNSILSGEVVNVCYAIYDKEGNFSKIAGTAIVSVLENTSAHIHIHLFCDNTLTEENKSKFVNLTKSYGQKISFYNIEELLPDIFEKIPDGNRFSKAAMYRLLMGNVLPDNINRVIYLDVDTVVNLDIAEFWREETGENGLAAISEKDLTHDHMIEKNICQAGYVPANRYFNSGVLLIDMEKFRAYPDLLSEGLELLKNHPQWDCYDQDILNYYFSDSYRQLPIYYDIFVEAERIIGNNSLEKGIYHYAGMAVDLFHGEDAFNRLWLHYFIKTPWFDENMLIKIFDLAPNAFNLCRSMLLKIFNETFGKRRVFLCCADDEATVHAFFTVCENDRFTAIDKNPEESLLNGLFKELAALSTNEIGVLCLNSYYLIRNELTARGFIEGKHFVNGASFLPSTIGGETLDGRHLIQKL